MFQDRKCFVKIVLALNVDLLGLHRCCVCNFFLLSNQNLLGLNLLLSLDPHFVLQELRVHSFLFKLRLQIIDIMLHDCHFILLLHQLLYSILVTDLLVIEFVPLLVEERLEDLHQVKESSWRHVIRPRRLA